MSPTPERQARQQIDEALEAAGWVIQDRAKMNLAAATGVAVREFRMAPGHGFADYLLFVHGKAVGVVEAKPAGYAPTNVEGTTTSRPSRRRSLLRCGIITLDVNHALRYYLRVIASFRDPDTEALAKGRRVKRFVSFESVARRKLRQLEIAGRLEDLNVPPGNRLELLKGDRKGQHSIRINRQFLVCFRWTAVGPQDVEIVDYH